MNLLDIASANGRAYKKVSTLHGGEYHGPCPACGGTDRFHIWPQQGDYGTFWCRGCTLGGDAIEYLIKIDGMSFPQACKEVGKDLPEVAEYQAPKFRTPTAGAETFTPRTIAPPVDQWQERAGKFVQWCHEQLLSNPLQLDYLAARGISRDSVETYRLGYNPGEKCDDLYRAREAWGLETVMNGDKKKKLWLPVGIVIPYFSGDTLRRVRIRIPADRRTEKFSVPYYLVPGSSMDTFITHPAAKAFVIVEAELDAIMVAEQAGDLAGTMAMGNSTAKPTDHAFQLLHGCLHISNALDYDARTTEAGKYENAGGVGWLWWKKHFDQVERWPVPVGKDPGDAFKSGVDIHAWVKQGLPPALTLPPPKRPAPNICRQAPNIAEASSEHCGTQDIKSGANVSASPSPAAAGDPLQRAVVTMKTAQDGTIYHITDNPDEYQRLAAAGEIVFDSAEIKNVIASGANQQQAVLFLAAKRTFPGTRITEVMPYSDPDSRPRQQWRGKYTTQEPPCTLP